MHFDEDTLRYALNRLQIPDYMHGGLVRWIHEGVRPGSFLAAILENDLKGAIENADENNITRIYGYMQFLYTSAPAACWGSKDKVFQWQTDGGLKKINSIQTEVILEDDEGE